jgi:hypothetical protein
MLPWNAEMFSTAEPALLAKLHAGSFRKLVRIDLKMILDAFNAPR